MRVPRTRCVTVLAPNAVSLPPDNPRLESDEAILAFYSELFRDENFSLDCHQELIEIAVAEDAAWSSGHCRATLTGPDGPVAQGGSKWAQVWKRMPSGDWKRVMNSWSGTGPPSD